MSKPTIYLSGPMDNRDYHEVHDWRNRFKELYGAKYCLDPTRQGNEPDNYVKIVQDDIADINNADIVLCRIDDHPMVGTLMEMCIAYSYTKSNPIVIVYNASKKDNEALSPWIKFHCHYIVNSLKEAVELCKK